MMNASYREQLLKLIKPHLGRGGGVEGPGYSEEGVTFSSQSLAEKTPFNSLIYPGSDTIEDKIS